VEGDAGAHPERPDGEVLIGLEGLQQVGLQFAVGVRFGFPALLALVIGALIWRPYGVFGRRQVRRV